MMKKVMTIAGSDSACGAGIQSDLKTFASLGVYGTSAITAITAQNTREVSGSFPLPPKMVADQIKAIAIDIQISGAKTGMLYNQEIIEAVSKQIQESGISPLVIDPVMISKSGHHLLLPEARQSMVDRLFPLAATVTPNIEEAQVLAAMSINKTEDMEKAATIIKKMGPQTVIIKGGHLPGEPVDLLYDGAEFLYLEGRRIPAKENKIHGLGCTLSAAITAFLALGMNIREAAKSGKQYVEDSIRFALEVGQGYPVPDHFNRLNRESQRYSLIMEMLDTLEKIKEGNIGELIPEVQSNMAAALPGAKDHSDIAGFPGRLVKFGKSIINIGYPQFGASRHVANIVLAAMKYNPEKRAAMNIKYSPEILEAAKRLDFTMASFDRKQEPRRIKNQEGSSLEWGTESAIKACGTVPDLVYDMGDVGKEPMIRLIAESPEKLGEKLLLLNSSLGGEK